MKIQFREIKRKLISVCVALMIISWCGVALGAKGGIVDSPDGGETFGNNLSFPVIWSEGVAKILQGTPGMVPLTSGQWWYWWGTSGTDPNIVPLSCLPDPDNSNLCDDGIAGQATGDSPGDGWVKAFLQKDPGNVWQADTVDMAGTTLTVDWIDWGDNLESVDWYTRSMVRTEVVLYQDLVTPLLEYEMRHVDGWGIDEVHGLAVDQSGAVIQGAGIQSTVYSPCARLTIQKLLVTRDDPQDPGSPNPLLENIFWDANEKVWTAPELINPPIFNGAVHEGEDGPGFYSAEINVKGKVIFGYTWNVRRLNDSIVNGGTAEGDYRVTFSFDDSCGLDSDGYPVYLQTFFNPATLDDPGTQLLLPVEEEVVVMAEDEGGDSGGASAIIDYENNLTYIDVRILKRTGGGGNKGGGNKGGGR